jgi:hypothetical protein
MAMLRMLGRDLHSNYGPTADTGGLMQNHAPTIYAYASVEALLHAEDHGGHKAPLPGPGSRPVTERPDARVALGMLHDVREDRTTAQTDLT